MADIQLTGDLATQFLDRVINGLSDSSMQGVMEFTGRAVGVAAEGYASEYPEPSGKPLAKYYTRQRRDGSTYQSKFKTLKQQRFVMALVAKGGVPYRRTGLLGRSITSDIRELSPSSVTVAVGTNDPKAKYVIGTPDEGQNHYFNGVWTPLQTNLDDHQSELAIVANAAFGKALRNILT
jgi:hypothetical protein